MPDVEARVALLEHRLEDQTRMLQELHTDVSALSAAHSADAATLLGAIRDLREEMARRFEQIDSRFLQIDSRFLQIDGRFLQIESRFQQVDEKIDRHFALLVGIQVATVSAFVSALVALYLR